MNNKDSWVEKGDSSSMPTRPDRRRFLQRLGGGGLLVAGLGGWLPIYAQSQSSTLTVVPLRDGLVQITGAGGNVVVLVTDEGCAMVDSGAPEQAASLAHLLAERYSDQPVELLLNTHWHPDHTGGNDLFGAAGATICAHENTRLWMTIEFYIDWQDRTYPKRRLEALPTQTFYSSDPQPIEAELGGRRIVYAHLKEAHTDGDLYVRFPDLNVLVAGGAVTAGEYPLIDYVTGGWIGGMIEATERLLELSDDETLIVPKTGPVRRRSHLQAQIEMLTTIRERVEEFAIEGKSPAEMLEAGITRDFDSTWQGDADQFLFNVYEGMWWTGGRLRGIVA